MSDQYLYEDFAGSKSADGENFPVGSFLIAPRHRPLVKAYYDFARFSDDIADSTEFEPRQKVAFLNRMQRVLEGYEEITHEGDPCRRASKLRSLLLENKMKLDCASDLLVAFRQDADKTRYKDWGELVNYCVYSANPVGRFLLSMHKEAPDTYPYSDALCTSLQILNHLQDMGKDLRDMNRCYIPMDWLLDVGESVDAIAADAMSPGLQKVYDRMLAKIDELNAQARELPAMVKDKRMRREARTIINLAKRLTERLKNGDPLKKRISLSKLDFAGAFLKARFGIS